LDLIRGSVVTGPGLEGDIECIFYHDLPENDEEKNGDPVCFLPKEEDDPDENNDNDSKNPDE
jgi:hypothetical protein